MREQVGAGLLVGFDQQPGRERLLERAQELVLGQQHHPLEQRRVHVTPDHRGDPQQLDRRRLEPAQPPGDDLLDALGQPEALELGGARAARVHPGLEQVADDLLDEERVSLGLLVQRTGERPRGRLAGAQPRPARRSRPRSRPRMSSCEASRSRRSSVRALVNVSPRRSAGAVRAQDQHPGRARGAGQVAQEQERRPVRPLEVVEHEQHGRRARELGEQPHHRLEQPVALGLGLVQRAAGAGRAPGGGAPGSGGRARSRTRARSCCRSLAGAFSAQWRSASRIGW